MLLLIVIYIYAYGYGWQRWEDLYLVMLIWSPLRWQSAGGSVPGGSAVVGKVAVQW